ncbi:MAG TPA: EI24 domain-containing protein, partial [Pseudonocardiaceae bacterium]|nr:EI24 domain-containing protein [Pseudonocardiaceae bacterium]
VARRPRLFAVGVAPALITAVLFGAGFVLLAMRLDEIASWLTPFAANWTEAARQAVQVLAGIAILIAAAVVGVISYTAVTLLIGGPFYEHLSGTVEDLLGGPGEDAEVSGRAVFIRGLRDSILLVTASLGCAVPLLVAGFVPLLGQTVVPVLAVVVGSWLLALEVVGVPFQRRGLRLRDRHRALRRRRLLTLASTAPAYLLCLIPFTAVLVMPVAVVAGTLLAREVLDPEPAPLSGPR